MWRFLKKLKIELELDQQSSAGHLPKDLESGSGGDVVPRVHRGTVHGSRGTATIQMSMAASGPRRHGVCTPDGMQKEMLLFVRMDEPGGCRVK